MKRSSTVRYLVVLFMQSIFWTGAYAISQEQQEKVLLRKIGDEFLMLMNDSLSRVLPISLEGSNYVLSFEKEFSFEPDMLFYAVFKVFEERKVKKSYLIEVTKCDSDSIVHSFTINDDVSKENTPCRHRNNPKDCFEIYFTPLAGVNGSSQEDFPMYIIYFLLGGGFFTTALVLWGNKKKATSNTNIISIGEYLFDKKSMTLTYNSEPEELSSREADLLFLLYINENNTLERDEILRIVWDDRNNYEGRTLDVFISKLRKKLSLDPNIKIINIRGIGYKFLINE